MTLIKLQKAWGIGLFLQWQHLITGLGANGEFASSISPRRFSFHTTQSGEGSPHSNRSALLNAQLETVVNKSPIPYTRLQTDLNGLRLDQRCGRDGSAVQRVPITRRER